jgi:hypothetical protein
VLSHITIFSEIRYLKENKIQFRFGEQILSLWEPGSLSLSLDKGQKRFLFFFFFNRVSLSGSVAQPCFNLVTLPPHLFLQYLGLQKYITVSGFLLFDAS